MTADKWMFRHGIRPIRPVREFEEMRRQFEEDIVRPVMHAVWERVPEDMKRWAPSIDVYEKGDNFEVKIELPGMRKEDIDVSVSNDGLTIKGERAPESGVKESDYHRSEIAYGGFHRSVPLPSGLDTKNIAAAYEDGILRVTFQKAAGAKPQKINIQAKETPA